MSEFTIRDGRGTGSRAKIDADGRLYTQSLALSQASARATLGYQFLIPVSTRTITTIDTEYSILRVNPTSASKRFHVQRLFISVLNSTPILMRLYKNSSIVTANNVTFSPGNTNTLSVNTSSISCDVWNGTGTGMTTSSNGTESFSGYFGQGMSDVAIDGSQIWGLNSAIMITAECSVTNKFTAVITGWEEDV